MQKLRRHQKRAAEDVRRWSGNNLFAAFFVVFMGLVAGQIVSAQPGVHASGIVVGEAAENAGLEPLDVILKIDNNTVETFDDFRNVMDIYGANDTVFIGFKNRWDHGRIECYFR